MVSPQATTDAITPVYIFLAVLFLIQALLFVYARETKGKSMEDIDAELEAERLGAKSQVA
jgi:preprotein translocase subunit SecG